MKKSLIILANIIIFAVLFTIYDYKLARDDYNRYIYYLQETLKVNEISNNDLYVAKFKYSLTLLNIKDYIKKEYNNFELRINNGNHKEKYTNNQTLKPSAIYVFGCSFAEGAYLRYNQKFEYKLNNMTGRTVYNFGIGGLGLSNMLWQIKNILLTDKIKNLEEPEYVFYVFIGDHFRRIYTDRFGLALPIFVKPDKLIKQHENKKNIIFLLLENPIGYQLLRFKTTKLFIKHYLYEKYFVKPKYNELFDITKLYFETSKKLLEEKYPDIKFVILKYPSIIHHFTDDLYDTSRWNELEKEGFIIIDLKTLLKEDITSSQYTLTDGHPNEKAWDIITKEIVKYLNL